MKAALTTAWQILTIPFTRAYWRAFFLLDAPNAADIAEAAGMGEDD
jgi:hypothetical protein